MAEETANKTEEPTPRRREEARAEGQIPQSAEITAAAVLLTAVVVVTNRGPAMVETLREMMRRNLLAASALDFTPAQMGQVMRRMLDDGFAVAWPLLAFTAAIGFTATVSQVGFHLYPKRLLPDGSKISPSTGFSRIVSKRGLVELVKALAKIALVAWITTVTGSRESITLGSSSRMSLGGSRLSQATMQRATPSEVSPQSADLTGLEWRGGSRRIVFGPRTTTIAG